MAVAGPVSDSLGLLFWFRIGGLVLALMGAAAFFIPAVMNLEEEEELPQTGP